MSTTTTALFGRFQDDFMNFVLIVLESHGFLMIFSAFRIDSHGLTWIDMDGHGLTSINMDFQ